MFVQYVAYYRTVKMFCITPPTLFYVISEHFEKGRQVLFFWLNECQVHNVSPPPPTSRASDYRVLSNYSAYSSYT